MGLWDTVGKVAGYLPGPALGKKVAGYFGGGDAKAAANKAGQGAQAAGQKYQGQANQGMQAAQGFYNPAQQQFQNMQGQMGGPGYLEQLYQKRASGQDQDFNTAYANQMQKGMASIGQNSAYAGAYNSGATQTRQGAFEAEMAGQRANSLGQLAGAAQGAQQGRLGQMFGGAMGLGGAQSGLQMEGTKLGTGYGFQGDMANIEAQLQGMGYDMQSRQALLQMLFGGAKAIGAGKGGA